MKLKLQSFLLLSFLLFLVGCGSSGNSAEVGEVDSTLYAEGFKTTKFKEYTQVDVTDPWDTTRLLQRYLLVDKNLEKLPSDMPKGTVVRVPCERVVVYASVHASILESLGKIDNIVGVCEAQFMGSDEVKNRISSGKIADLGDATSVNVEKILDINADLIITSPFKDTGYGAAEKLGIPIAEGADYMENTPLGRVEWIKLYSMFVGAEQKADSIFKNTCSEYLQLKSLTDNLTNRPTLLVEKRYGGQWFVPNGNSYSANLYKDAGADYIFENDINSGALALSFETVLDRAIHADFWLVKYNHSEDLTYTNLKNEYEPYSYFDAFKNQKIYGCNSAKNNFYEDTPMYPQRILKDYISIFHPELLPDYKPRYFLPL